MDIPRPHLVCIAWGPVGEELKHLDCPVIVRSPFDLWNRGHAVNPAIELPAVCPCECQTCKRAWWAKGRPRVVFGVIYSEGRLA